MTHKSDENYGNWTEIELSKNEIQVMIVALKERAKNSNFPAEIHYCYNIIEKLKLIEMEQKNREIISEEITEEITEPKFDCEDNSDQENWDYCGKKECASCGGF